MGAVTEQLAEHVLTTRWDDLPEAVRAAAGAVVFDALPVTAAGAGEEPARLVRAYLATVGGAAHCTLIGGGGLTSAPQAAFANGVAGHVLDYEPMWHPPTHPTSPVLPVALALAEWRGRDGRDVLTALVAGFEVQARLLLAMRNEIDALHLHPPGTVGVLGAAATAAWLLDLDPRQTCMALGIAASRAGGLMANVGTMTKATHCGNAGRMGLESALLASLGFTANEDILGAPRGYGDYFLRGATDLAAIIAGYGRPFRIHQPGVAIKKYPSQYGTQRAIDAALAIARAHPLPVERIAAVTVTGPRMGYVDRPQPISGLDGKFSFQYVTTVALLDGVVGIGSFSDARRFAPDVEALLPRVRYAPADDIPANFDEMWIHTAVELTDGTTYTAECRKPTGIWGIPLSDAQREVKARDCLARVLPVAQATGVIAALRNFAALSAAELRELLATLSVEAAIRT